MGEGEAERGKHTHSRGMSREGVKGWFPCFNNREGQFRPQCWPATGIKIQ